MIRIVLIAGIILGSHSAPLAHSEAQRLSRPGKKKILKITLKNLFPPYLDYNYFPHSKRYSFPFNPTSFNLINAWWLAEVSSLVYAGEDFFRSRFKKAGLPVTAWEPISQCFPPVVTEMPREFIFLVLPELAIKRLKRI